MQGPLFISGFCQQLSHTQTADWLWTLGNTLEKYRFYTFLWLSYRDQLFGLVLE